MEAHSGVPRSNRAAGLSLPRSRRLLGALGDDRLVEQVRRGNDAAFEAIFDRYHRGILAFCRHMLSSPEEAEDAVQHSFIQAYDSMRRGDRELKLKAWLYTIARNRCLSMLRARREQAAELHDLPTAGLAEEVQQRSDLRDLLGDIRELPDDQRAALVLSEVGDLSHPEIATVVGCEPSKVKSLVFQARTSLIETRKAREVPCHEIREQLATATGAALRRGPLRRHVRQCTGCAEFRDEVARQRRMMAVALPVVPGLALKHGVLAAVGIGGGGGAAAAGGTAAGGGIVSLVASSGAGKAAAVVALAGATVGSGVAIEAQIGGEPAARDRAPAERSAPAGPRPAAGGVTAPPAAAPGRSRGEDSSKGAGSSQPTRRGARRDGKPGDSRGGRGGSQASPNAQDAPRGNGPPPHSNGSPQSGDGGAARPPRENVPGTNGNGQALPPTSNGGVGGGNSGAHLGTTKGERPVKEEKPEKEPKPGKGEALPTG
jgi:RNA polymerase sigma factor (sigma-70 family)